MVLPYSLDLSDLKKAQKLKKDNHDQYLNGRSTKKNEVAMQRKTVANQLCSSLALKAMTATTYISVSIR